jgi:hypothetical protein
MAAAMYFGAVMLATPAFRAMLPLALARQPTRQQLFCLDHCYLPERDGPPPHTARRPSRITVWPAPVVAEGGPIGGKSGWSNADGKPVTN